MAIQNKLRILIIAGGPSSERDVSLATGKNIADHIDRHRYTVETYRLPKRPNIVSLSHRLRNVDVVLNALHGAFGEDGVLQSILEAAGIPYTGSGPQASAVTIDKHLSNLLFQAAHFQVPQWWIVTRGGKLPKCSLPIVVKPVNAGSSVDTYVVRSVTELRRRVAQTLRKYRRVMLQQFIKGREITCGVVEGSSGDIVLAPTEIMPLHSTWFDFHSKYKPGASRELTPAPLSESVKKMVQSLALRAHALFDCRGMSRSDFIYDGKRFWILEINTIPGLTSTSLLPQGAAAVGITFSKLIDLMIMAALRKG